MAEPESDRPRQAARGIWLPVAGLTLVGVLLRIPTLGLQSYEFDEAATLKVVDGSLGHVLHKVAVSESTPPVYYVLAWLWRLAFGTGEFAFRLLPAIAGALLIPVVFELGRTLASRRVGLVAAAIVASSPYLVFYSQEARAYSLFTLLSILALLLCIRAIHEPTGVRFAAWAAVSIAAVATHYFALFPLAGQFVAFLLSGVNRRRVVVWAAVVATPTMPLLLLARHQAGFGHVDWIATASLLQRIRVCIETFALGATFKGSLSHAVLTICGFFALVIGGGIAVGVFSLLRRTTSEERRAAILVAEVTIVAVAIPLIGALGPADYFIHKNLIPVLPQAAVLLALGLGGRHAGRLGVVAATCIVVSGIGLTVLSFAVPSMRRPDVRQVSDRLGTPDHDRVLVFIPRWELVLENYQPGLQPLASAGRRVDEIDVFTSSRNLPSRTVPPGFRHVATEHGNTFNLYRFSSATPRRVRPSEVGQETFSESGLQPIAVFQPAAGGRGS